MQLESARLETDGAGLATLTLTQAQRGNPFDGTFVSDMKRLVLALWETAGLRGVLLRAEGPNFSFGGDLKSFQGDLDRLGPLVRGWTAELHMGLQRLWQLPVPIVAEVQGFAMGGGVALVAGCDVVVAARSARFGSAFAGIGFSCDSGSTLALTMRMGAARAKRFVMLAQLLDSAGAQQAGLVDEVVDDSALAAHALNLARELAAGPTVALGEIKRLFLRAGAIELSAMLEDEALTLARVAGTRDAREGILARIERRKPAFEGR